MPSASGGRVRAAAHTGPPACPRVTLTPRARSRVLLPDMLEPVTSRNDPGGPTVTSLPTRVPSASSGCPRSRASSTGGAPSSPGRTVREAPPGLVPGQGGQRRQRLELAEGLEPAADGSPGGGLPAFEQPEGVEVPQGEHLDEDVEGAVAGVGALHAARQAAHPAARRLAVGGQRRRQRGELRAAPGRCAAVPCAAVVAAAALQGVEGGGVGGELAGAGGDRREQRVEAAAVDPGEDQGGERHDGGQRAGHGGDESGDADAEGDERQQAAGPHQRRAVEQPRLPLGPGEEGVEVVAVAAAPPRVPPRWAAAPGQLETLAQLELRRQLGHRRLAQPHLGRRRRGEQPARQRGAAGRRARRRQQAGQRHRSEEAEVAGQGDGGLVEAGRRLGRRRQVVPAAFEARQPLLLHRHPFAQPPLLVDHPGVDHREDGEAGHRGGEGGERPAARRAGLEEDGEQHEEGGEGDRQAGPREGAGAPRTGVAVGREALAALPVDGRRIGGHLR